VSVKIYNGCILNNVKSLDQFQKFLDELRSKIGKTSRELIVNKIAEVCTDLIDSNTFANLPDDATGGNSSVVSSAFSYVDKQYRGIYRSGQRSPEFDFGFDVSFCKIKGKLLALYFTEQRDYVDIFMGMDQVEEYWYWNNADKPEELTDDVWDKRSADWKKALPTGIPSDSCFGVEFVRKHLLAEYTVEEILEYIPNKEERADFIGRELLREEVVDFKGMKKEDVSEIMKKIEEFDEWLKTDEGVDALNEKIKVVLTDMVDIDLDVLNGSLLKNA
jgi:hypothetical protein